MKHGLRYSLFDRLQEKSGPGIGGGVRNVLLLDSSSCPNEIGRPFLNALFYPLALLLKLKLCSRALNERRLLINNSLI